MAQNGFFYFTTPGAPLGRAGAEPMIPLPNPGEGGPVYPGDVDGPAAEPVIPLPSPGEGGPVYPGNGSTPSWPSYPGGNPWPAPPSSGGGGGGTRPRTARVRFLNAAYGYQTFRILVGGSVFASRLNYASVSNYGRLSAGYQTVTVTGTNGYVHIRKSIPIQANTTSTVAIIQVSGGLDLLTIPDACCAPGSGLSNLRIGNLAYNSGPLDVLMSDGRVVYSDLRYKEVGAFRRIMPGTYQFFYADTNQLPMPSSLAIEALDPAWLGVYPPYETFGSLYLDVGYSMSYTVYLLQSGSGRNQIQNLILSDRV